MIRQSVSIQCDWHIKLLMDHPTIALTLHKHSRTHIIIVQCSSSSRTDLLAHFQLLIASQATNPQPTTFSFIHNIQRKREDRRGRSRSLCNTISTTTTTHHHHYPPQLLQMKRWEEERREEEPQKTQSHSHMHSKKSKRKKLTIKIMGCLFPLLVWDTPSSSMCGKGPALLENSKMRLVKKLYITMHFFRFFSFFIYFFCIFSFLYVLRD